MKKLKSYSVCNGYLLFILIMVLTVNGKNYAQNDLGALENSIREELGNNTGIYAIAFGMVNDPEKVILINEYEVFHAASTMKTPVMIEVFRQAEEGHFSLDDSILVKNEFKSIVDSSLYSMDIGRDSGDELYEYLGKKRTIRQLMESMVTRSSNLATNILIGLVDAKNVTQTMRNLGADKIKVLRGVEDMKAFDLGMNNTTTAHDLFTIFNELAAGRVVSEKASKEMVEILARQEHNNMIPAGLPEGVKVAHKTGWISGVRHDSGIVYPGNGNPYVLVFLSKELKDDQKALGLCAGISKKIYEYVKENYD